MRTGTASLPLHGGKCPPWLFSKMKELAPLILEAIVLEYGPLEVLKRLSEPGWFQALGCVLGFDWHSSGVTTTVCGAIKEGIRGKEKDLGLFVAGGKGSTSRKTPSEILELSDKMSLPVNPESLIKASRLSAKVDNSAVQDGYQLYHHCFFFTGDGHWSVVQQGMDDDKGWARRYHWLGDLVTDFTCEPHSAICCDHQAETVNLVAAESGECRSKCTYIANENTHSVIKEFKLVKNLNMPRRHDIPGEKYLEKALLKVYENQPKDFESLLCVQGVGPKTLRALSMLSEVIFGAPPSYRDPARYSFAHGGKDGHPYPVDRELYDRSIGQLEKAVSCAKIGVYDKMKALKVLANFKGVRGQA